MEYYDPNDRRPRLWAILVTTLYVLSLGSAFAFVSFDFSREERPYEEFVIELVDAPVPQPAPKQPAVEPRRHTVEAAEERTAQTEGEEPATRTPNPKALFKMNRSGADEPANAGNPQAREGEEQNAGRGEGLNPDGLDQLDKGLRGRGLVGDLPRPSYPGSKSGKILIRVTVNAAGEVTNAVFEPVGSTQSDGELVAAAIEAAYKARFTESRAVVQGGTITYIFSMK